MKSIEPTRDLQGVRDTPASQNSHSPVDLVWWRDCCSSVRPAEGKWWGKVYELGNGITVPSKLDRTTRFHV